MRRVSAIVSADRALTCAAGSAVPNRQVGCCNDVAVAQHWSTLVAIRGAVLDDISAIAAFQTRCWNEAYVGMVPMSYLERVSVSDREVRWRERLATGVRLIALAESAGDLVGVVSWGAADEGAALSLQSRLELKSLYVSPELRGRGLAQGLLAYAIGSRPALLWVFRDNLRAQTFYRKHGFQVDGYETTDVDTGLEMLRMSRD